MDGYPMPSQRVIVVENILALRAFVEYSRLCYTKKLPVIWHTLSLQCHSTCLTLFHDVSVTSVSIDMAAQVLSGVRRKIALRTLVVSRNSFTVNPSRMENC